MSSDYSYDEQGQFYPFFIFTLSTIVTLPLTYSLLAPSKDPEALAQRIRTDYKPEHADLVKAQRDAQKRRQRRVKRAIAVILGWAIMAGMMFLIVTTQRTATKLYNPYDILGVSDSANEQQIKRHYKRLSIKYHPDKVRPDPAKNETIESMTNAWVEMTKAYQALTDEEIRNNYIQYGHPDGKQGFSIGIALPKFIVSDGNGKYVVLVYAVLLGVLLPYTVGSWWYGVQRMSKEGVQLESANLMFREYKETMAEGDIITALSSGIEYRDHLKGDKGESGLSKIESKISQPGEAAVYAAGFEEKDKIALEDIESGRRRKVLGLLWAYLGRVELDDQALNSAKYLVAPIANALLHSFTTISIAFGNAGPIISSYLTSQRLIQAIPPKASPLFQLPHFTSAVVQAIEGDSKKHATVQQFMSLPDAQRRSLVVGKGLLTEEQYQTAVNVAQQLPHLHLEKAFFKVTGERVVTPGSLVTLVIKGRVVPPGSTNIPDVNELDLEDIDPAEDDLDALLGRKKVKDENGKLVKQDSKPVPPPLTFAPYYARDITPKWHVLLSDSKQGKMAVPPCTFTAFDKPMFTEDGKPTYHMLTLKAPGFAAPPQPGQYTFVMNMVCDSYVGFDAKVDVTLTVEDAAKAAQIQAEDEISDPDEDSLAGQMSAMKGGPVKKRADSDDSDEESGTDEEEDDTDATNTDTEDES